MKTKNVITCLLAFAVGAAAGWFAAGVGRAVAPRPPQSIAAAASMAVSMKPPSDVKPKRKARAKPVPEVSAAKTAKSKPVRPEAVQSATTGDSAETPKADGADAEKKAKEDNPFPRYLDMFRNEPAALAAEFEKEAEADRARQRKMREQAIAKLKLNEEQAALFEKALDDIRNAFLRNVQEEVDLITSGQANMDTAADGRFWDSNLLLMDQAVAAREKIVRDAAVELYNQLNVDGVPDAEKQRIIKKVTYNTSFSFDCYEPMLQVYDKVYKNMGFGNGIFSWCIRQSQKK